MCLIFYEQMDDPSASISLAQLTKVYIHIYVYVLENVHLLASYFLCGPGGGVGGGEVFGKKKKIVHIITLL